MTLHEETIPIRPMTPRHDSEMPDGALMRWACELLNVKAVTARKPDLEGRSRQIWIMEGADAQGVLKRCVIRHDSGAGPWTGTAFTLGREAQTLRAVRKAGIPAPDVLGVSEAGDSVAIAFLEGSAGFDFADDALRRRTIDAFLKALIALHRLDVDALDLPFQRPTGLRDHALLEVAAYQRSYNELCARHPQIDTAFDWLTENAPAVLIKTSLLQGDAGPGNFLHADGVITGLVDWEAAHFGDPMGDLAWFWFRKCFVRRDDDLGYWYARYAALSGRPVDIDRISYYRVLVLVRAAVAVLVRQAHDPDKDETKPRLMIDLVRRVMLDPLGRRATPDALPSIRSFMEAVQA